MMVARPALRGCGVFTRDDDRVEMVVSLGSVEAVLSPRSRLCRRGLGGQGEGIRRNNAVVFEQRQI